MDKVSYTSQLTQHLDTTMAMVNSTVSANSCMSNDAFALLELIGFPTFTSSPYVSPHELHLLVSDDVNRGSFVNSVTVPSFTEFTESAAKFTSLCSRSLNGSKTLNVMNNGKFQRASSSHVLKQNGSLLKGKKSFGAQIEVRRNDGSEINLSKVSGSGANSSEDSEQIQSVETNVNNNEMSSRKRKGSTSAKDEDGNAKCSKQAENAKRENVRTKTKEGRKEGCKEKATEPQKDYIHVRARRGEATDSHSLAERVRREKISERMKLLQDLVPGCNKVTGKALMLEEIINYVQSLQRQVEFMSMKLASVNSELEFNMNNILSKDMLQQKGIVPQQMNHLDSSTEAALYNNYDHQSNQNVQQQLHNSNISSGPLSKCSVNHDVSLDASLCSNFGIQLPYVDVFSATVPELPAFGEDELHIIQNEFSQNPVNFPVPCQLSDMKAEW